MFDLELPLTLPRLAGARVLLRAFEADDHLVVEQAATDASIPMGTTVPAQYSLAEALAFIDRQHGRARTGEGYSLAIVDRASNVAVGQVGLWISRLAKGRAELGYWVVPSARRRGFAAEAVDLLSTWAFGHLPVARLSLFIEPWNIASIKVAERAGFHREGLLERWEMIDGIPKDMLAFARFPADPENPAVGLGL